MSDMKTATDDLVLEIDARQRSKLANAYMTLSEHQKDPDSLLETFATFVYAVLSLCEMEAVSPLFGVDGVSKIPDWTVNEHLKIYKCQMQQSSHAKRQALGHLVVANVCRNVFTVNFVCENSLKVYGETFEFNLSNGFLREDMQNQSKYAKEFYYKIRNSIAIPGRADLSYSIGYSDSALQTLPNEVLYEIVDYLDIKSLYNLSLTCKRLNEAAKGKMEDLHEMDVTEVVHRPIIKNEPFSYFNDILLHLRR